jgi:hypothetical protein
VLGLLDDLAEEHVAALGAAQPEAFRHAFAAEGSIVGGLGHRIGFSAPIAALSNRAIGQGD